MAMKKHPLRLAIDLGSATTRMLVGKTEHDEVETLPTVFAQGSSPDAYVVGKAALRRRPSSKPVFPFRRGFVESMRDGLTYVRLLEQVAEATSHETWAVLSAPSSSRDDEPERLAKLAGKVFDRVLVVPGITLATIALRENQTQHTEGATMVNMGAVSLQVAVLDPARSEPNEITHFAGGGNSTDARLEKELRALLPELRVSPTTARTLKEKYAAFEEAPSACLVQIIHQRHKRVLDIGTAMFNSVQPILGSLVDAVSTVLGDEHGERALSYGTEVILIGGGAQQPGLDKALLAALRAQGYPTRKITIPENPAELAVRGAWRVARMLTHQHWDVLV